MRLLTRVPAPTALTEKDKVDVLGNMLFGYSSHNDCRWTLARIANRVSELSMRALVRDAALCLAAAVPDFVPPLSLDLFSLVDAMRMCKSLVGGAAFFEEEHHPCEVLYRVGEWSTISSSASFAILAKC